MLHKCDVRLGYHFAGNKVCYYGLDQSGEKVYRFNSLGFRGDEFNPKAVKNIFIAGCSYTLGVGLNFEETWGYQFKQKVAKEAGLGLKEIGLMNFSVGGASNDYITRILLTQMSLYKPDLVIAYFTHSSRIEYIDESSINMLGPWCVNSDITNDFYKQQHLDDVEEAAFSFFSYTTQELEFINMLKNMLLLQEYCKSHNIKLMFGSVYSKDLLNKCKEMNSVCSQFLDLLDTERYFKFNLDKIDAASDNSHPGVRSNKKFAEKLFETYQKSMI